MSRYEKFTENEGVAHITTSLTASEIEGLYGTRFRSCLREMFNVIAFSNAAKDKREISNAIIGKPITKSPKLFRLGLLKIWKCYFFRLPIIRSNIRETKKLIKAPNTAKNIVFRISAEDIEGAIQNKVPPTVHG